MKNRRTLQFAFAGLFLALSLQVAGYVIDHSSTHGGLDTQVPYNWLSLLLVPISLLPRLNNPDAPLFYSWSTALLVLVGNSVYYAALCKFLELFFLRLSASLPAQNAVVVNSKSPSAVRRIPESALDLHNV